MSGIGAAATYSIKYKVDFWSGEKIHEHHSDPVFLGGDRNQTTTSMRASTHRQLHQDMNDFLYEQRNELNQHMRPQSNNPGSDIRDNFTRPQRIEALKSFYDTYKWTYPASRYDFYLNNDLNWRLW